VRRCTIREYLSRSDALTNFFRCALSLFHGACSAIPLNQGPVVLRPGDQWSNGPRSRGTEVQEESFPDFASFGHGQVRRVVHERTHEYQDELNCAFGQIGPEYARLTVVFWVVLWSLTRKYVPGILGVAAPPFSTLGRSKERVSTMMLPHAEAEEPGAPRAILKYLRPSSASARSADLSGWGCLRSRKGAALNSSVVFARHAKGRSTLGVIAKKDCAFSARRDAWPPISSENPSRLTLREMYYEVACRITDCVTKV